MSLGMCDANTLFLEVLKKYSDNKNDPIPEWHLQGFDPHGGATKCICETPILLNYRIIHKRTQVQLLIGSECVKRWLNPRLECEVCKCPLGCIMKRYQTFDFKCRKCKTAERKEQERLLREAEEMERARLIAEFRERERKENERRWAGEELFRGYGKHFLKPFRIVAEDIPFVTRLVNLPKEKVYEKNLIDFLSYVSMCYDIVEIEVDV